MVALALFSSARAGGSSNLYDLDAALVRRGGHHNPVAAGPFDADRL